MMHVRQQIMYVRSLFDACAPANYVCAVSVRTYLSDYVCAVCMCGELGAIIVSAIIVNAIIASALYICMYVYMYVCIHIYRERDVLCHIMFYCLVIILHHTLLY